MKKPHDVRNAAGFAGVSVPSPFDGPDPAFLDYYNTPGGVVRRDVVRHHLASHLPPSRVRVLDLGCGQGLDAVWLVRAGHDVVAVDPSQAMLSAAKRSARDLNRAERARLSLHRSDDTGVSQSSWSAFDVVLCHGVLMYQDDDVSFVKRLATFVRPGGIVSLVARNAEALAFRSAAAGRYSEALDLLHHRDWSVGRLGVRSRAHSIEQLVAMLGAAGLVVDRWYGVKVFADPLDLAAADEPIEQLVELETAASAIDPYRRTARLLHVIARRRF